MLALALGILGMHVLVSESALGATRPPHVMASGVAHAGMASAQPAARPGEAAGEAARAAAGAAAGEAVRRPGPATPWDPSTMIMVCAFMLGAAALLLCRARAGALPLAARRRASYGVVGRRLPPERNTGPPPSVTVSVVRC